LNEIGQVLLSKFDGQFVNTVKQAESDAVQLMYLVVNNFSSFDDRGEYRGKEIHFYKRAQILVADVWARLHGQGLGDLKRMNELTAFADYKIPQILRHYEVLNYGEKLEEKVDSRTELEWGSAEEIEIRAATVVGVDMLAMELAARDEIIKPFELDYNLWVLAQKARGMKPFHLVRTTAY